MILRLFICDLTYLSSLLSSLIEFGECGARFVGARPIRFFSLNFGFAVTAPVDLRLPRLPLAPRQERFFLVVVPKPESSE